ncbi:DUF952 domain-containing protein [Herbiconiux ginsengi]|uniref:Uncharacterized protein n=1 Tax=Herbiconiux ginsengi TaxID=381665 RepID=A0A1H3U1N6_9MICO|nr:hypothetical protein [Herbiconiux ginsengi]SDZ56353.1 hypothetical protein SAMN05216554_0020 [Herbiconiux ginsengi]
MAIAPAHLAPLDSDDIEVVQDFMVTKTMLLVAREADVVEWRFEYEAARAASEQRWDRNHFLLDYTLARLLVAIGVEAVLVSTFPKDFLDEVRAERFAEARTLWLSLQSQVNTTVTLLAALTAERGRAEQLRRIDSIPRPYAETSPMTRVSIDTPSGGDAPSGSRIFHIAIADDWEASQGFGTYEASTRGKSLADEGYIHAVTRDGLDSALAQYCDLALPLVLVTLGVVGLRDEGIEVDQSDVEQARILGAIPTGNSAVVIDVTPLTRNGGQWCAPDDGRLP